MQKNKIENRIKELREKAGINQTELAEISGVSRTVINQLETGARTVITSETMLKISKGLGCPANEIFLI